MNKLQFWLREKKQSSAGSEFTLLNLPFYLVHRIERELDKIWDKVDLS
jgi:hypothetical protein